MDGSRGIRSLRAGAGGFLVARPAAAPRNDSQNRPMEPLFGLIAAAIAASVAYLVTSERRRAQMRVWRAAVERAGLTGVEEAEGGIFEGAFVCGASGDLRVRLASYRKGKYEHGTKIVLTGLGQGAGGLSLRREGLGTAIEKRFIGEREIEVGDAGFDDEYYVQGLAPLALAILEPETRRKLAGLLRGQVAAEGREPVEVDASLSDGILEVRIKESGFSSNRERIPDVLPAVLDVARRLVAPETWPPGSRPTWAASRSRARGCGPCSCSTGSSRSTRPRARRSSRRSRTRARRCACARRWRSARRVGTRSSIS